MFEFCEYLNSKDNSQEDQVRQMMDKCVGQRRADKDANI